MTELIGEIGTSLQSFKQFLLEKGREGDEGKRQKTEKNKESLLWKGKWKMWKMGQKIVCGSGERSSRTRRFSRRYLKGVFQNPSLSMCCASIRTWVSRNCPSTVNLATDSSLFALKFSTNRWWIPSFSLSKAFSSFATAWRKPRRRRWSCSFKLVFFRSARTSPSISSVAFFSLASISLMLMVLRRSRYLLSHMNILRSSLRMACWNEEHCFRVMNWNIILCLLHSNPILFVFCAHIAVHQLLSAISCI